MKDEYGRSNTRAQVIRNLANFRIAVLLDDIKKNPEKYPTNRNDWTEWLEQESGENILNL